MNKPTDSYGNKMKAVKLVLSLSVLIVVIKFIAFYISNSGAVLSDALESIINIATSGATLYSIYYGARLRDEDHPYGHGKIEYLAIGFEGALIFGTGIYIIYHSIVRFIHPGLLLNVEGGLLLTAFSGVSMYFIGSFLKKKGRQLQSDSMIADGIHFHIDTITSFGLVAGLLIYQLTGLYWIDPLLAMLLAFHIMRSGIKLIREAADRLMDKVDLNTLGLVTAALQKYRRPAWIDVHNLRVQRFGQYLHIDCHLTLPFYLTLEQVHDELKILETYLNRELSYNVELFIHTDPCQQVPCSICATPDCPYRLSPLIRQIEWTNENMIANKPHRLDHNAGH